MAKLVLIWSFATWQLVFLATSLAFYDILPGACAEIKISIFNFFRLSFSSFSFLFAAVIDLLLGLLAVKKVLRKRHRDGQFLPWSTKPRLVAGNFAPSFSLNFLSIFVHISGSIRPITLIWVLLERSFPPAEVEHRRCQFGQK